ncbi:hypothetical protein [Sphingobacterium multivorum]|uniref:hypothetical protein n=1 Tax=Sphingobacterium multivorum TaxID=28454 RepID=UPI0028B15539|nr:hypothetical protein [Sphingobacterium multivorum]
MNSIEVNVVDALEKGESISLNHIGGINTLLEQDDNFFRSKILDEILQVVLNEINEASPEVVKDITSFINKCLLLCEDEFVLKEISLSICRYSNRLEGCFKELISLLSNSKRNGFFRSQYLISAFSISLTSATKKHSLIAYLLEEENFLEDLFQDCYYKILGLAYSHFNVEELLQKLEVLLTEELSNDELLYEVGMAYLNKGLNSDSKNLVIDNLKIAKNHFNNVDSNVYPNAICFEKVLEIFLDFFESNYKGINIESLTELENKLQFANLWQHYNNSFTWQSLRESEIINWKTLVSKLKSSADYLSETSWFEPKVVIENFLLQLYKCNRTIFYKKESNGVDLLIEPYISARLIENDTYSFLLDQWLIRNQGDPLWEIGNSLYVTINEYKNLGNEFGVTLSNDTVTPSKSDIKKFETKFEIFSKEYRTNQLGGTSLILKAEFERLSQSLIEHEIFPNNDVKFNFQSLLYNSLLFLETRMDSTKKNNPSVSYLFNKSPLPKEEALQKDYSLFIGAIPSNGNTEIEVMDIAGGRADVVFKFIDHRFIVEVKREINKTGFDDLISKYSGQSFEYQNTNVKAGILLVLDLNKANLNGIKSFEQQVKLHIISDNEGTLRSLIIIKVPGRRNTPSQIK